MVAQASLPMDLISEEILHRLPAKSLCRFKCVSKFFLPLISSPEFINRHLHQSLSSSGDRLLIIKAKSGSLIAFHLDLPEFSARIIHSDSLCGSSLFIIGSCSGLVCVGSNSLTSDFVFNPSTGLYWEFVDDPSQGELSYPSSFHYGFGFDHTNNDYKIVRVLIYYPFNFDPEEAEGDGDKMKWVVEIFSLNSNFWKTVDRSYNYDVIDQRESSVLIDNQLVHWTLFNFLTWEARIICFDLEHEQWGDDVPLPDFCSEMGSDMIFDLDFCVHLGVLDGCLCLLTDIPPRTGVDVWVMKEYGVKESWVRLFNISNAEFGHPLKISPLSYGKGSKSEILFSVESEFKFFWYHIRDQTWREAKIKGVRPYYGACILEGSLVNLDDSYTEEEEEGGGD